MIILASLFSEAAKYADVNADECKEGLATLKNNNKKERKTKNEMKKEKEEEEEEAEEGAALRPPRTRRVDLSKVKTDRGLETGAISALSCHTEIEVFCCCTTKIRSQLHTFSSCRAIYGCDSPYNW